MFSTAAARALLLSIFTLVLSMSAFAQLQKHISGTVVDQNGERISGAVVRLYRGISGDEYQVQSNAAGEFSFSVLADGEYGIRISANGFASERKIFTVPAAQPINITLKAGQVAAEVSLTTSSMLGEPGNLNEIPGSVERISARQLENSRVFNFSEALRKVAGVNVRDEEGFGLRPNIGIRGTNPTRSSKVLLLEDGIPFSYAPYGDNASYYHPPVERFESIEVLKGSGQIAYGPQTIAGVINYLTPNPPDKPSLRLRLEGGNRGFFNGGVGFGDTFRRLGMNLAFNHKRGDGTKANNGFKLYDLANKATFELNSRNHLTAKFNFYREHSNVSYTGATEAEYSADARGNAFKNDFFYGRRYGISLQHAVVLTSNVSLVTNAYTNYFSRDWWRQSSNSSQRPNRLNVDPDCRGLADLNTTCGNEGRLRDYLTQGVEPRITASFKTGSLRHELNAGFRVHSEDQERLQKNGDLPNSRDGVLAENNERKAFARSAFIQHRTVWGDLALTPGIRFENIRFSRTNRLANGGVWITGRTTVNEIIPGLGVAYAGIKNTTVFAGVHRGFSPPRAEDVVTNAGAVVELDSELSWNWEVGVRTRPISGVEFSSTFFRNDYENQIVAASIAGGAAFTNGGRTLQQGFEVSASLDSSSLFQSSHNFYLRTAYTALPVAEFRGVRLSSVTTATILDAYCPEASRISTTSCSIVGNRLPYTPRTNLTTSVGYSNDAGIDAFVEHVYIGRQFGDDLNAPVPTANGQMGPIDTQTNWNATANYRVEKWKTTFFVTGKNLLDRTLIVDRSRGILPSMPRLIQAGVSIKF